MSDAISRQTATADYGTNSGTAPSRPNSAPSRSDTVLVSSSEYNSAGEAYKTIDPASREDRREFDDAGRATKTIQNYVDGNPATGDADEDVTVETAYNADGLVETLTAKNSTTGDQVTKYVYGTAVGGITPLIYRNDLLRAVIYPDSDDPVALDGNGTDGVYDRVEYKYNRQHEPIWVKDPNGTIHEFAYDGLGRQTQDRVTTVGTGIDDAVRRIARTYEVRSMVEHLTSYDDPDVGEGNVLNDVLRQYDTLARPTKEYQEHNSAKDANTLYVESSYANFSTYGRRLNSVRYPNGRKVHFDYSSTDGSALNRLDAIKDDNGGSPGNTLAEYTYLGRDLMVVEDFVQPDVKLDYYGGTSGSYAGFDNFGRVVEQLWRDYGASADRDKFTYGYDRAGNRLYREHVLPSGKDERYTYDGVYQLTVSKRGDLNQDKTAISGTPAREEDFTFDPLGNWSTYVQKTSGNTDLDQDRTHNKVNELTDISEEQGEPQWITPAHDRAGNMTTVPKPSSLANGLTLKYDAWNRLVQVTDGQTIVAKYEYDGEDRRIKKHIDSQSPSSPNGIDRYEHLFYVDTQLVETRNTTTQSAQPESLQPKYQYVWSPRYIDAPILRDENTDQDSLCDDGRIYYLCDANQNVMSLVDTNGDALERYIYDPYGRVTIYNAAWSSTRSSSSYSNYVLYTGRHLDPETGLYYYRARYYSAELGRFMGRDPISYWGGDFNLYCYVHNNPLNRIDPTGYAGQCPDKCKSKDGDKNIAEQIKDLLGKVSDISGLINTVMNNADLFSKPGAMGILMNLLGNPGADLAAGLALFGKQGSWCNQWLRSTFAKLQDACKGHNSGCSTIGATSIASVGSTANNCANDLMVLPGGGKKLSTLFVNVSTNLANKCTKLVKDNKSKGGGGAAGGSQCCPK